MVDDRDVKEILHINFREIRAQQVMLGVRIRAIEEDLKKLNNVLFEILAGDIDEETDNIAQ